MTTFSSVGSPGTVGGASGGYNFALNNITTTPTQVLNQDPQRRSITWHNPGTIPIYVAQTVVQNSGTDVPLTPSPSALGGCWLVPPNGGILTFDGECQKPWQAFAPMGTTNPLTIKVSRT